MSMENSNLREERKVDVSQTGGFVRSERVVEDVSAKERQNVSRLVALIRWIFGVIEALIGLRILLELIAANPGNPFARLVYSFSDLFVRAFRGLTTSPSAGGIVLDIPAIVALLVYALVGWGISRLIWILFSRAEARRISVYERRRN